MSLQPQLFYLVLEETAQVARAAFPNGNLSMRLYDTFGTIFRDRDVATLFSSTGQPAASPVRVALATILQFAAGLSDRQAADAVRSRIDWKYLLCLELTDPGFDHTVLSEFRARLREGEAEMLLFDTLLMAFREQGLLKARGKQRTDSTHVLAAIRALNRLECVGDWTLAVDNRDNDVIKLKFATTDCSVCPQQAKCTQSSPPRRTLTIRPKDQYQALQAARARQVTSEFKEEYGTRAGIEGTMSQGIRAFEMRRSRYIGLEKTHLQHVLTAAAMNMARVSAWLVETPRAKTRQSAFERLYQTAA